MLQKKFGEILSIIKGIIVLLVFRGFPPGEKVERQMWPIL
jgi:hypothetical protein